MLIFYYLFKLKKKFDNSHYASYYLWQVVYANLRLDICKTRHDKKIYFTKLGLHVTHIERRQKYTIYMSKKIKIQYHLDKEWVGINQIDNPQNTINTLTPNNRI